MLATEARALWALPARLWPSVHSLPAWLSPSLWEEEGRKVWGGGRGETQSHPELSALLRHEHARTHPLLPGAKQKRESPVCRTHPHPVSALTLAPHFWDGKVFPEASTAPVSEDW